MIIYTVYKVKLNKKPNNIFTLVKFMKKDGKIYEKEKNKRLGFSEKGRKKI